VRGSSLERDRESIGPAAADEREGRSSQRMTSLLDCIEEMLRSCRLDDDDAVREDVREEPTFLAYRNSGR
jgi:hypothetical protein